MTEHFETQEDPSLVSAQRPDISTWLHDLTTRPDTGTTTQSSVPWQGSDAEKLDSLQEASKYQALKKAIPSFEVALNECHYLDRNPETFSNIAQSLAESAESGVKTIVSHMEEICPAPRRQYVIITALILAGTPRNGKHTVTTKDEEYIRSQILEAWHSGGRDDDVQEQWNTYEDIVVAELVCCFKKVGCDPRCFDPEDYSRITKALEHGFEGEWAEWTLDSVLGDTGIMSGGTT